MPTIYRQKAVSNGVTFNDATAYPSGALSWGLDIMDGWKDTPEPEESSVELGSFRDGVSAASFFPIRKRYVTVGGWALAQGHTAAEALADVIVRDAFPRNQLVNLTRYEGVPKFVLCRRSGPIEMDWSAVHNGFRWQTTMMCEDPFKYGLTPITGSTGISGTAVTGHTFPVTFPMTFAASSAGITIGLGLFNAGTAPSSNFTATVNGYLAKGAWRIANDTTGGYLGFNTAVQITDQLVIDFRQQLATLNGFPISTDYTGAFWQLAPGANTIRLYAEYDANALVTVNAYSAWE